jgi:hypothetical protein
LPKWSLCSWWLSCSRVTCPRVARRRSIRKWPCGRVRAARCLAELRRVEPLAPCDEIYCCAVTGPHISGEPRRTSRAYSSPPHQTHRGSSAVDVRFIISRRLRVRLPPCALECLPVSLNSALVALGAIVEHRLFGLVLRGQEGRGLRCALKRGCAILSAYLAGPQQRSSTRGSYPPIPLAGTADVGEREHRDMCAATPTPPVAFPTRGASCF